METLSIKVSKTDKARLQKVAQERKISLSALLREGLEQVVHGRSNAAKPSCYALAAKYFEDEGGLGASGFGDLSTNKKWMEGFGK